MDVLLTLIIYDLSPVCITSNTTDATKRAGTAYFVGSPEFNLNV